MPELISRHKTLEKYKTNLDFERTKIDNELRALKNKMNLVEKEREGQILKLNNNISLLRT